MRLADEILLTDIDRDELIALTRSELTSGQLAQRVHIVLLAADGLKGNARLQHQHGYQFGKNVFSSPRASRVFSRG